MSRPSPPTTFEPSVGDGNSWTFILALAALVTFTLLGVVVWSGAQLSALAWHHHAAPVSFSDAADAIFELPRHLSDPANAWPDAAHEALPGPIPYWLCTILVTAMALTAAGLAAHRWAGRRSSEPNALGVNAYAGFARPRDLNCLRVRRPESGRLTLGRVGRQLVAAERQTSLAVVGPTGCGKTAGFAIPALLEWQGPVIATSVKSDLVDAALMERFGEGDVWVYDPTDASGIRTDRWTPLSACTTWHGALRVSAWLCEAAQPRTDSVTDGDYWYTQARRGLAPYLHAAAVGHRTIADVVRWIDTEEVDEVEAILLHHAGVPAMLEQLLDSDHATKRRDALRFEAETDEQGLVREQLRKTGDPPRWATRPIEQWPSDQQHQFRERVEETLERRLRAELQAEAEHRCRSRIDALTTAQALWNKEARLRGSVYATIENVIAGYADPGVAAAADLHHYDPNDLNGEAIDLDHWLSGNNTIFVIAPPHEQARLRPVLSVLVQQAIRTAYETANRNGGVLPHPCLVLLDEAGNIAPLRDLPTYASTARSHDISLVSIWQDLAQIKTIYGDRAQTVLNNHRAKLFGSGIADRDTLEYLSRLIGDERHTQINLSGDLHGQRRSMSEHTSYRPTASTDVLRRLRTNEAILLYGRELPARIKLRPWYVDVRPRRWLAPLRALHRRWRRCRSWVHYELLGKPLELGSPRGADETT